MSPTPLSLNGHHIHGHAVIAPHGHVNTSNSKPQFYGNFDGTELSRSRLQRQATSSRDVFRARAHSLSINDDDDIQTNIISIRRTFNQSDIQAPQGALSLKEFHDCVLKLYPAAYLHDSKYDSNVTECFNQVKSSNDNMLHYKRHIGALQDEIDNYNNPIEFGTNYRIFLGFVNIVFAKASHNHLNVPQLNDVRSNSSATSSSNSSVSSMDNSTDTVKINLNMSGHSGHGHHGHPHGHHRHHRRNDSSSISISHGNGNVHGGIGNEKTSLQLRSDADVEKFNRLSIVECISDIDGESRQLMDEIDNLHGVDPDLKLILIDGMTNIQEKLFRTREKCTDMDMCLHELELKCDDLEKHAQFNTLSQNENAKDVELIKNENIKLKEKVAKLKAAQNALADAERGNDTLMVQLGELREDNDELQTQLQNAQNEVAMMEQYRNERAEKEDQIHDLYDQLEKEKRV